MKKVIIALILLTLIGVVALETVTIVKIISIKQELPSMEYIQ